MKRVRVLRNGLQTHGTEMEDPTAWIAEQVAKNAWGKPGEYTVEIEDITAEITAKEAAKAARRALINKVKAYTSTDINTLAKAQAVLLEIIEAVGLKD